MYASPHSTHFEGKVLGPMENAVATVARSRSGFFGCATSGVKAICAYRLGRRGIRSLVVYEGEGDGMRIWVQVRGGKLNQWVRRAC
jgi:hypothetical protein